MAAKVGSRQSSSNLLSVSPIKYKHNIPDNYVNICLVVWVFEVCCVYTLQVKQKANLNKIASLLGNLNQAKLIPVSQVFLMVNMQPCLSVCLSVCLLPMHLPSKSRSVHTHRLIAQYNPGNYNKLTQRLVVMELSHSYQH